METHYDIGKNFPIGQACMYLGGFIGALIRGQ